MIWAFFSLKGIGRFHIIDGKMNGIGYVKIIKDNKE